MTSSRRPRWPPDPAVFVADVGAGVGIRRRSLDRGRLEAVLAAHDACRAAAGPALAKDGPRSVVTRHGDLVVKEARARDRIGRWKDRVAPGRHRSGVANAWRLETLGVATARAQAWVRRDDRIFALYDDLSALPRLDHEARRRYAEGAPSEQVALRVATAAWLRDLHRRGIYHGDLKAVNVLVGDTPGGLRLHVIDTDRVLFFPGPVSRRRRLKNLAQLAASIPTWVGRTERLRFCRGYGEDAPWPRDERADVRALARRIARRRVVGDRPLE